MTLKLYGELTEVSDGHGYTYYIKDFVVLVAEIYQSRDSYVVKYYPIKQPEAMITLARYNNEDQARTDFRNAFCMDK